jgi:hypothetical protein
MNGKRVERIWRQDLRSYDFVLDRTADGRSFRMLTIVAFLRS